MKRTSVFSYRCGSCGLCCRDKVITLAPYDVMRMAAAAALSTRETIAQYTTRRGSLLRFAPDGACAALRGLCTIHSGRPLPCRLYPLGLERTAGAEHFVALEAAPGSKGLYGEDGTVGGFLDEQGVEPYLAAAEFYFALIPLMRARIASLVDFEKTEPAEFRRVAVREAMAESGYDFNPLIEAMFDSDRWSGFATDGIRSPVRHATALRELIRVHADPLQLAAAAVLLSVSLGYTPAQVFVSPTRQSRG
ncbi:MAG TPA: YkgJ family cysteine cluster protein [Candidatus Binataceae bacterium]|nr:YkgJ family cysteine cluster protein [Candidatus Binataceae bacterium]